MDSPVTLIDLIREGKLLWAYCNECGHERDLEPAAIDLPPETPAPDVGKRMKCSSCGRSARCPSTVLVASLRCARGGCEIRVPMMANFKQRNFR